MKDISPGYIHHTRIGDGARDVLAIHCTLAHSGAWKGLARAMNGEVTLHAFDMPSHGRSADWDPASGDYQDLGTQAALQALTRPMDLLGHSFGATVALRAAVERPELVRSLTLIEPVLFAVARQDAPELLAAHDDDARPFAEAYEAGETELAARLFNRMWSDGRSPRWPDLPQATRDAMVRAIHVVPACRPSIYDDRPGVLAPGVLDRVTAPSQVLRGSLTHPAIGAINDGLERRLPNAENHIIEGAGHMVALTHPVETARHLRDIFVKAAV